MKFRREIDVKSLIEVNIYQDMAENLADDLYNFLSNRNDEFKVSGDTRRKEGYGNQVPNKEDTLTSKTTDVKSSNNFAKGNVNEKENSASQSGGQFSRQETSSASNEKSLADDLYDTLPCSKGKLHQADARRKEGYGNKVLNKDDTFTSKTTNVKSSNNFAKGNVNEKENSASQSGGQFSKQETSSASNEKSLADDLYDILPCSKDKLHQADARRKEGYGNKVLNKDDTFTSKTTNVKSSNNFAKGNVNEKENSASQSGGQFSKQETSSANNEKSLADDLYDILPCSKDKLHQADARRKEGYGNKVLNKDDTFTSKTTNVKSSNNFAKGNVNEKENSASQSGGQFSKQETSSANNEKSLADDLYDILPCSKDKLHQADARRKEGYGNKVLNKDDTFTSKTTNVKSSNNFAKGNVNEKENSASQSGGQFSKQETSSASNEKSLADDLYDILPCSKDKLHQADARRKEGYGNKVLNKDDTFTSKTTNVKSSNNFAKGNVNEKENSASQSGGQFSKQETSSANNEKSLADDLYDILPCSKDKLHQADARRKEGYGNKVLNKDDTFTSKTTNVKSSNNFAKGNVNEKENSASQSGGQFSKQETSSASNEKSLADDLYDILPCSKDKLHQADARRKEGYGNKVLNKDDTFTSKTTNVKSSNNFAKGNVNEKENSASQSGGQFSKQETSSASNEKSLADDLYDILPCSKDKLHQADARRKEGYGNKVLNKDDTFTSKTTNVKSSNNFAKGNVNEKENSASQSGGQFSKQETSSANNEKSLADDLYDILPCSKDKLHQADARRKEGYGNKVLNKDDTFTSKTTNVKSSNNFAKGNVNEKENSASQSGGQFSKQETSSASNEKSLADDLYDILPCSKDKLHQADARRKEGYGNKVLNKDDTFTSKTTNVKSSNNFAKGNVNEKENSASQSGGQFSKQETSSASNEKSLADDLYDILPCSKDKLHQADARRKEGYGNKVLNKDDTFTSKTTNVKSSNNFAKGNVNEKENSASQSGGQFSKQETSSASNEKSLADDLYDILPCSKDKLHQADARRKEGYGNKVLNKDDTFTSKTTNVKSSNNFAKGNVNEKENSASQSGGQFSKQETSSASNEKSLADDLYDILPCSKDKLHQADARRKEGYGNKVLNKDDTFTSKTTNVKSSNNFAKGNVNEKENSASQSGGQFSKQETSSASNEKSLADDLYDILPCSKDKLHQADARRKEGYGNKVLNKDDTFTSKTTNVKSSNNFAKGNVNEKENSASQSGGQFSKQETSSASNEKSLADDLYDILPCSKDKLHQADARRKEGYGNKVLNKDDTFTSKTTNVKSSNNFAKGNVNEKENSASQSGGQFSKQETSSASNEKSLADDLYDILPCSKDKLHQADARRKEGYGNKVLNKDDTFTSKTTNVKSSNNFAKGNVNEKENSASQSGGQFSKQETSSASNEKSLADDLYDTLPCSKDKLHQKSHIDKDFKKRNRSKSRFGNQASKNDEQYGQSEYKFKKLPQKELNTQTFPKSENASKQNSKHRNEVDVASKNKHLKSFEPVTSSQDIHSQCRNEKPSAVFRRQTSDSDHSANEKWERVTKQNKYKKKQTHQNVEKSAFELEDNKRHGRQDRNFSRADTQKNFGDTESTSNMFMNEELYFHNTNQVRARQHILGYKELEKLSEEDDPYEIVQVLANGTYGFEKLLKQQLKPDFLTLVVKLLSKLCNIEFVDLRIQLLSSACNFDFLDQLSRHIAVIPLEKNKKRKANIGNFFEDLMLFLETVINLLPTKVAEESFKKIFMMTDITMKINEQQQLITVSEDIKKKFEEINNQYRICIEGQNEKKTAENINAQNFDLAPDDFRDISLFPTSDDILSDEQPFIRPNIVEGAYKSVDHYLDIQFRLLREDFVSPLREGISQYIDMGENKYFRKISNVRIYRKVLFLNPKIIKERLGLIVSFDPDKKLKKIVWEHTKRFMFGSLLVFSNDSFSSVIFATVMERNIEDLKKGRIVVQLSEGTAISNELFMNEFVMAESNVYFEPYYHVMNALQKMGASAFPMENYIVHAEMSDNAPKYLVTEGGETLDIDGHAVSVLKDDSWPSPEKLKLDESQYNAFKACLTREFSVVQGPPGTGKTFLGLKIAKVLLKNFPVWNASRKPILVVCYTNHALDQFLEGLIPVTERIVRVGGQSKSKILEAFNLREVRKTSKKQIGISNLMREIRFKMSDCMNFIKRIQANLEFISNHEGIISLSILKEIGISHQQLACFEAASPELSNEYFIEWLEYGIYNDPLPNEEGQNEVIQNPGTSNDDDENEAEDEVNQGAPIEDAEDRQYQAWDDALDLNLDIHEMVPCIKVALSLQKIQDEIEWVELQLKHLNEQILEDPTLVQNIQEQEMIRDDLKLRFNYIKYQLNKEEYLDKKTLQQLLQHNNLWELQTNDRWHLYRYWVERLQTVLIQQLRRWEGNFRIEARMYEDAQRINDLNIMKNSLVVGMTTTGAARLQNLLNALRARIVIVEEAAEVFESHIVVSLTHHCEHLILIGDHKQLRPSPAVYKLAQNYKFDISLFERMLTNNMHCEVLKVQHRMRPEIVQLIVPTIYPELKNHSSVLQFERIRGMLKSVFFITHNHPEEEVDDISSHKNTHEGDFLMELCRYLVLQGYEPSRITILATYSGQMFYLRNVRKQYSLLSEVRITVIDNFQGEENDIILLSLVRSNKDARIGFLKTENRVCVALSRARMGLYIIGNMDNLSKSCAIWQKIRDTLKQQDALSTHLTLRCQIHPSEFSRVCSKADFSTSPEGGCKRLCEAELSCGHKCKSVCHVRNREHEYYRCVERCERIPDRCELGHQCLRMCWENCGNCKTLIQRTLPCGHIVLLECGINPEAYNCKEIIEVELPICGHKVEKPCYKNIETFPCSHACENRVPCGHRCRLMCHTRDDPDHLEYNCLKQCDRKNAGCKENHLCEKLCYEVCGDCKVSVERDLPNCEHKGRMPCSKDPRTYCCYKKCQKKLNCGHDCQKTCCELCEGCPVKVIKRIEKCGHTIKVKCCETPHQSNCIQPCKKILQCGHPCRTVCSAECTKKCYIDVESKVQSACGHAVHIPCSMQNENLTPYSEKLLSLCRVPCGKLLDCKHQCVGTCGECRQGRTHKSCKEKCGRVLICGHSCNVPCAENCPPCNRKCLYKCKHSKCPKQCGQPCIQCKEPCDWACVHKKCKKLCFELCDRGPCNEPCDKLLPCKHPCIGFCGETCPPLCRICNEDEVTEIFFGNEDEPEARFVLLEDCKHTFEATGLEQWMTQSDDNEIKLKVCPNCKTTITKTERYMNIVKNVYQDIWRVKHRIFGELREIQANRDELTARLIALSDHEEDIKGSKEYESLYNKLLCELKPVLRSKENMLSSLDTGTLRVQIEIFSQLVENYYKVCKTLDEESKTEIFEYLDTLFHVVKKRAKKISAQEVNDISMEIQRFYRLCQLYKLRSEPSFRQNRHHAAIIRCFEAAHRIAYTVGKFTKEQDTAMKYALETFGKEIKSAQRITDVERKEIVQVMGFTKGHWYKCPNGHIYAIGECGRAMQIGKCNECGAQIGGTQHRLLSSNALAFEMDGAARPAYP